MNKRNGFTLIELLAVIVILAIIALIAIPIILNIISDAKKSSDERSAELAVARKNLKVELGNTTCDINEDGNLTNCTGLTSNEVINVEMDGKKPSSGTVVFTNGKISNGTSLEYKDGTEYSPKVQKNEDIINTSDDEPEVPENGDNDENSENSSNLVSAHISSQQIWDCQRSPANPTEGLNFTLSGLDRPLNKHWDSWEPQDGQYLQVMISDGKARLDEYDKNGNKIEEFSGEGTLYLLDREKHIYFFSGSSIGYVFCTDPVEAEKFYNNGGGSFPYEGIEIVESLD